MPETPTPGDGPGCDGMCMDHAAHLGGTICELPRGHDGDHECVDCPGYLRRRYHENVQARVRQFKALRDIGFYTTRDED
ncbi:MAG TPA: hypothetical protein VHA75_20250 [Rugosimonospora sp.]|nr:hypothetical protein [Rugosimonospora sp.]